MNGEDRRIINGHWAENGLSFVGDELVAYNSAGDYCKLEDAGAQGLVGYCGTNWPSTTVEENAEVKIGYFDLLNDPEYPVTKGNLYRADNVYLKDAWTVTSNPESGIEGFPSVIAFNISGDGFVTIEVCPPGS